MLGARNTSQIEDFFTRGRHENLNGFYISHSSFGLPRQSFRTNSDRTILFKQSLRDAECMYRETRAYNMAYYEIKELCREGWSENFKYLCIDMSKLETKVSFVFPMKAKTQILNAFPKMNIFSFSNVISN